MFKATTKRKNSDVGGTLTRLLNDKIVPPLTKGLESATNVLFDESQKNVPTDTLALKDSGEVEKKTDGNRVYFQINYGKESFGTVERYSEKQKKMRKQTPYRYAKAVQFRTGFLVESIRIARDPMRASLRGAVEGKS